MCCFFSYNVSSLANQSLQTNPLLTVHYSEISKCCAVLCKNADLLCFTSLVILRLSDLNNKRYIKIKIFPMEQIKLLLLLFFIYVAV